MLPSSSPSAESTSAQSEATASPSSMMTAKDVASRKKFFTPIQTRRFWSTPGGVVRETCRLCPSMDVIVLGLQQQQKQKEQSQYGTTITPPPSAATAAAARILSVHRTVSWQKLAVISSEDDTTSSSIISTAALPSTDDPSAALLGQQLFQRTTWSPDGRLIACCSSSSGSILDTSTTLMRSNDDDHLQQHQQQHRITLYHVEDLLLASSVRLGGSSSSSSANGTTTTSMIGGDMGQSPNCRVISLEIPARVDTMTWAVIGKLHPSWTISKEEEQVDIYWTFRQRYLDRDIELLPPSAYQHQNRGLVVSDHHQYSSSLSSSSTTGAVDRRTETNTGGTSTIALPTCKTPLSILYVATDHGLCLYLHGRYPLLLSKDISNLSTLVENTTSTTTMTNATKNTKSISSMDHENLHMVVSTELTHVILYEKKKHQSNKMILYSIPDVTRHRYTWQTISALYCGIMDHIQTIQSSIPEIAATWKSSMKPLDMKLDGLIRLLQNYGLDMDSIRSYLVQYILSGHTRRAPNLTNAMDQFFTSVHMNDQLLQRLESSMVVALSNVEVMVRESLLSPVRAMVFQIHSLQGLTQSEEETNIHVPYGSVDNEPPSRQQQVLLPYTMFSKLLTASKILYLTVETTLTNLIDARFRLRDFMAWLRSTGSQIKARGTASNSAQRENARKRRVPDVVVQRILSYLQRRHVVVDEPFHTINRDDKSQDGMQHKTSKTNGTINSLTEDILDIRVSSLLRDDDQPIVVGGDIKQSVPTVPHVCRIVESFAKEFFYYPQRYLSSRIHGTELVFMDGNESYDTDGARTGNLVAVTIRLGRGGFQSDHTELDEPQLADGFFSPLTNTEENDSALFRQWMVVAQTISNQLGDSPMIRLSAVPLTWTTPTTNSTGSTIASEEVSGVASGYFWTTILELPKHYKVHDIAFYTDDGKSSLSSGIDSGSGKEGRQSLGLLLSRSSQPTDVLELWLITYDDLSFDRIPLSSSQSPAKLSLVVNDDQLGSSKSRAVVQPAPSQEEGSDDDNHIMSLDGIVLAKTRAISTSLEKDSTSSKPPWFVLSGPRGVGAVFHAQQVGWSMDLYDLEEDEEEEDTVDKDDDNLG